MVDTFKVTENIKFRGLDMSYKCKLCGKSYKVDFGAENGFAGVDRLLFVENGKSVEDPCFKCKENIQKARESAADKAEADLRKSISTV